MVQRECLDSLFHRGIAWTTSRAVTVAAIAVAFYLISKLRLSGWSGVAVLLLFVIGLGYIHDITWIACWRPNVIKFIKEHGAEL
ncbi:MAG TPA: hypothetical protein VKY92_16680 [Verrucomicrobiae bacterium]|nr:hypothetical protein [Verrucomicrobiae bacterium]